MKIEDQVCSLKLSKRLRELGAPQNSLFYWSFCNDCAEEYGKKGIEVGYDLSDSPHGEKWSAFTVAELGEMLPESLENPDEDDQIIPLICEKNDYGWELSYSHSYFHILCKTEADARARMLIFLLETGIIQNG